MCCTYDIGTVTILTLPGYFREQNEMENKRKENSVIGARIHMWNMLSAQTIN